MDRDGTICVLREYLRDPDGMELLEGAAEAISLFNRLGLMTIVVSNQSGIGRGYFTEEVLDAVHERMGRLLEEGDARLDVIYYCVHHPDEKCDCRKPRPGLLHRAEEEFGVDLSRSYMIGDRIADVQTGKVVGAKGILVLTGYGTGELALREKWEVMPDHIVDNLLGAAEWIEKDIES